MEARNRTVAGGQRAPYQGLFQAGFRMLASAALVVVTLGLIAATLAVMSYQRERDATVHEFGLRARAAAAEVDRYVVEQLDILRAVAAAPAVIERNVPLMKEYLDRVGRDVEGFDGGIGFIDGRGQVLALSGYEGPPVDASNRQYVGEVLATGRPYVSEAVISVINAYPMVFIAVPVRSATGAVGGLVAGGMRLDRISDGAGSLRIAGASEVVIADRLGQLIVRQEPVTQLESIAALPWYEEARRRPGNVLVDVPGLTSSQDHVVAFDASPTSDWLVLVESSSHEAFGDARGALAREILVVGLVTLASVAALWVASLRIGTAARQRERAYEAEHEARARAEQAVDRAEGLLAQLRERERLREAFIGMLSHELRTPVTTIYGAAKLLARHDGRSDSHGLVEDIEEESDRLFRIIEDLLVLSRTERGQLELGLEPVLLQHVLPIVVGDVERRFPFLSVSVNHPADLPPVMADPGPLRQVLNNLLTNAAKYGDGSPVRIRVREEGPELMLTVEDEGPGFPVEEADHLFDLFYRSESTAKLSAGTGIGLYVVRELVLAMGGTVAAEHGDAGGAVFRITLPVADGRDDEVMEPSPRQQAQAGAVSGASA